MSMDEIPPISRSTTLEPTIARVGNGVRTRIRATEKALEIVKSLEQETEEFRETVVDEVVRLLTPEDHTV